MVAVLEWMYWTIGTSLFVVGVVAFLTAVTLLGILVPSTPRKGFLPIETARGDRIYIGLLGTGLILILLIALSDLSLTLGLGIAAVWVVAVVGWG
jgi:predicted small integral membrane protein